MRVRSCLPVVVLSLLAACASGSSGTPADNPVADVDAAVVADNPIAGETSVDPGVDEDADVSGPADAAEVHTPDPFAPGLAAALQQVLEEYLRFSGDPGVAFAIHDGDRRWWSSVAGLADVRKGEAVGPTSLFRVGSNTKPIVATWILQLVEEGSVDLDAPLTKYLPEYPQWEKITVRHLLGMQGGIPENVTDLAVLATVLTQPDHVWTPVEIMAAVKDKPLLFEPGTAGAYSNSEFILLGMIGEKVTGRKAADELRDRFFVPLGMTSTRLETQGDPTDNLVHGYMDLAVIAPLLGLPDAMFIAIPQELYLEGTRTVDANTLMPPSLTWTAGAIVSRPDDLAEFHRALQTGKLIGPDLLEQMRAWHPITLLGGTVDYGLGLMRYVTSIGDVWGHGGLNFGFHVESFYQAELDIAFSHMHNFLPAQTVAVTEEAMKAVLAGAETVLPACTIPDAFYTDGADDGPAIRLRFKGVVGEKGKAETLHAGMASAEGNLGAEDFRLYGIDRLGIFAGATVTTALTGQRLEVIAWGATPDGKLRQLSLNLDPVLLGKAGADGSVPLAATDHYAASAVVIDIELAADRKTILKTCVNAMPDYSRTARLHPCDGTTSGTKAGQMLRLGALLPMTTDTAKIDAYLKPLQIDRCTCFDEGAPVPCT
jgi:D-alanyl-D-alanine carboxypeptidase